MPDFKEAQGVKTHRDDEFKIKLVDGQSGNTSSHTLTIAKDGDSVTPSTNDFAAPVLFKTLEATPKLVIPRTDPSGNVRAVIVSGSNQTKICDPFKHSGIAEDASSNHDKVVSTGKTAKSIEVICASAGWAKFDIGEFDGISTFTSKAVVFTSPSSPAIPIKILHEIVGNGTKTLRVRVTNMDTATDIYTTVQFIEE